MSAPRLGTEIHGTGANGLRGRLGISMRLGRRAAIPLVAGSLALATAACGGSTAASGGSGSKPASGGTLQIATVFPFSGPNASYGPEMLAGCKPAVYAVNKAGGILGHKFACHSVDTVGDPADGVAAVRKMLASDSAVVGVTGPDGGTADAVAPILNASQMTMGATNGNLSFDHNTYPYYWRVVPSDSILGTAMAVAAHAKGYTRAALLFGNDSAAQAEVPPLIAGYKKLGGTITDNVAVAPNQANYLTELSKIIAGHPQVILTETDPATAGTIFRNLKELAKTPIPVMGTATTALLPYFKAIQAAAGVPYVDQYFSVVNFYSPNEQQAINAYVAILMNPAAGVAQPKQYANDTYSMAYYDEATLELLAMVAAHSVKPSVYNSYMTKVTGPGKDVVVHTFSAGKAALDAGKTIQYVGPSGPIIFNKYHNTFSAFVIDRLGSNASLIPGTILPVSAIQAASS